MIKLRTALLSFILMLTAGAVRAASSDALTVTVRPNAYYAVEIDTGNVSLDLGTIALGASTQTVRPSTVSIQSTFASTDLVLRGIINSAVTPWSFDSNTANQEANTLAAWATFTSVARSSAPTQTGDYFSGTVPGAAGSDVLDGSNRYVGDSASNGTTNLFENNSGFDSKNMDGLLPEPYPAAKSHLWLYFRLPSATATADPQNITIYITATQPN